MKRRALIKAIAAAPVAAYAGGTTINTKDGDGLVGWVSAIAHTENGVTATVRLHPKFVEELKRRRPEIISMVREAIT